MVQQTRERFEVRTCILDGFAKQVGFLDIGLVECYRKESCSLKFLSGSRTPDICMHQVKEIVKKDTSR